MQWELLAPLAWLCPEDGSQGSLEAARAVDGTRQVLAHGAQLHTTANELTSGEPCVLPGTGSYG